MLGADDELLPDGLRSFFLGENDFEYDIIYGNTIDRYFMEYSGTQNQNVVLSKV